MLSISSVVEGSFDGNSLKVAELLFKNGFKEAYAIEGGLRGKDGWEVSPLSLSEICSFVRLYIYIYIYLLCFEVLHAYCGQAV